jgi:hypothetical protein
MLVWMACWSFLTMVAPVNLVRWTSGLESVSIFWSPPRLVNHGLGMSRWSGQVSVVSPARALRPCVPLFPFPAASAWRSATCRGSLRTGRRSRRGASSSA